MAIHSKSPGLRTIQLILKRTFDFSGALLGLFLFAPLIASAWIIASIETQSNGFYLQKRVGFKGILFSVVKIKTMKHVEGLDMTVTASNDVRITRSGAFLRNSKIDELPQLWNVLLGQMSFVGPRPDVPGYADKLKGEDWVVLSVRPGITGPASLKYKDEEELLSRYDDPEKYNDEVIWPDKVRINREYVNQFSLGKDFYYLWKTIVD